MTTTILDCYTDEPAGLGVPPYLGTYPRYIYGQIKADTKEDPYYITIDDLRLLKKYDSVIPTVNEKQKTKIDVYNLTKNHKNITKIIERTTHLIVILGVHVPGKYLSAIPGTLKEILPMLEGLKCKITLTGPAATDYGTQLEGGKRAEKVDLSLFSEVVPNIVSSYNVIARSAVLGAGIISQIPDTRLVEIETGRGCVRDKGCSYCTEPLKHDVEFRSQKDIVAEVAELSKMGIEHFRLGKQSCFYSYKNGKKEEIEKLLKPISALNPKTLHIDNANPQMVDIEKTKLIVKYCTPGNIAAFGVESFDPKVQKANNLNCDNDTVYKAVKIVNEIGGKRSENGMHHFLPGLNILFGLNKESKKSHEYNMEYLTRFLDEDLLLRRINVRKVMPLPGTKLHHDVGNKYLKKNKKFYWKWRNDIRQNIDYPMLKKLTPIGTIMKDVVAEVHDGGNTFGRQIGTYPLIVGVKQRLELKKSYNLKIVGHMLRSITGEVIE